MRDQFVALVATLVVAGILVSACSQASPALAPTKVAASAPTAAPVAPTKVPATSAAPTAAPAPAKKVDYPAKGKTVTLLVPFAAGGATDVLTRTLGQRLEKELGVPVQVENKPGAASQIGLTEWVQRPADGYTIAVPDLPTAILIYQDPERKAIFSRKDFQMIAMHVGEPGIPAVNASSPYKTLKEVLDGAKTNPDKIKAGDGGALTWSNVNLLLAEKAAGVKFNIAHFDGGAPNLTALMGGHIDLAFVAGPDIVQRHKEGAVRIVAVCDKKRYDFLPEIPTAEEQGYKIYSGYQGGFVVRSGTPKEIVDILRSAFKKVIDNDDYRNQIRGLGANLMYKDGPDYETFWNEQEAVVSDILQTLGKKK